MPKYVGVGRKCVSVGTSPLLKFGFNLEGCGTWEVTILAPFFLSFLVETLNASSFEDTWHVLFSVQNYGNMLHHHPCERGRNIGKIETYDYYRSLMCF